MSICNRFDEFATPADHQLFHQCNGTCRIQPSVGQIGGRFFVTCQCSGLNAPDLTTLLAIWNNFNRVKKIASARHVAEMKRLAKDRIAQREAGR